MEVYLASRPANRELNEVLAAEFEGRGHRCAVPGRDDARRGREQGPAAAIRTADVVLLVGPDIDTEVAWKAGYARALGKRIVLVCPAFETACDHAHMADDVARIGTLDDAADVVTVVLSGQPGTAAAACAPDQTCRSPLRYGLASS